MAIEDTKKPKAAKAGAVSAKKAIASAKKKFAAKSKNDVNVMIKVKDDEGKIVEFETDQVSVTSAAPKKKKKVPKAAKTATRVVKSRTTS